MPTIVVADTGPLIALAKVDRLPLLQAMFGQVYIPPAVHHELFGKSGLETRRLDEALGQYLHERKVPSMPVAVQGATETLDQGERQAIALAATLGKDALLLIDDQAGRTAARQLKLRITGVVGILIRAWQSGLVGDVRLLLEEMRRQGYWLSDELLDVAAKAAAEA